MFSHEFLVGGGMNASASRRYHQASFSSTCQFIRTPCLVFVFAFVFAFVFVVVFVKKLLVIKSCHTNSVFAL